MSETDGLLENDGSVIRDKVDTTQLLHELASDTEQRPITEALAAISEKCFEAIAMCSIALLVYGSFDRAKVDVQ